jgi:hypothetical protein
MHYEFKSSPALKGFGGRGGLGERKNFYKKFFLSPKITKSTHSPPSRVPEEMEPCIPGWCSVPYFTAPNVSSLTGTSQPVRARRSANRKTTLSKLQLMFVGLNQWISRTKQVFSKIFVDYAS